MSVSLKNTLKRAAMYVGVAAVGFSQMGCGGGDDPVNPRPSPEPGPGSGTGPITEHKYSNEGNNSTVNVKDSLITIYAGGGTIASVITLSVRKGDLDKGNDVKFFSESLSSGNVREVRNGIVYLEKYNLDTKISPSSTKYLGSNPSKGKLSEINIAGLGIVGVRTSVDEDRHAVTKEQITGILDLAHEKAALVGHEVIINKDKFNLKPTN